MFWVFVDFRAWNRGIALFATLLSWFFFFVPVILAGVGDTGVVFFPPPPSLLVCFAGTGCFPLTLNLCLSPVLQCFFHSVRFRFCFWKLCHGSFPPGSFLVFYDQLRAKSATSHADSPVFDLLVLLVINSASGP